MKKLLVIDDNLDFLGFLTSALEKYFEVYTATGVKDALRLLEYQKVEAICSDYNMRDGTGLDLLRSCRERNIAVPFMLMSACDSNNLSNKAELYGITFCEKADCEFLDKVRAMIMEKK